MGTFPVTMFSNIAVPAESLEPRRKAAPAYHSIKFHSRAVLDAVFSTAAIDMIQSQKYRVRLAAARALLPIVLANLTEQFSTRFLPGLRHMFMTGKTAGKVRRGRRFAACCTEAGINSITIAKIGESTALRVQSRSIFFPVFFSGKFSFFSPLNAVESTMAFSLFFIFPWHTRLNY